jgi:ribulose-5-phosphate 4-epimerase/fuculose-1-phosphate aldolase
MTETKLLEDVCRVGASLFDRGYVHAMAGNISVRLPQGGYVITPTDACLGTLDPGKLAHIDANGQHISGDRPSKTLTLHRRIYDAAPQAQCVIHTHSTHLVALSALVAAPRDPLANDDLLPPITPYFVMKVGHVPHIPYHRPGDPAVGEIVAQRITQMQAAGTPIRAVMLERLGPNVWHRTPAEASAVLEELEETARLWLMTRTDPLSPPEINELRHHFDAAW